MAVAAVVTAPPSPAARDTSSTRQDDRAGRHAVPPRTTQVQLPDGSEIVLEHEILYSPDGNATFAIPGRGAVGRHRRRYQIDHGDRDVKVFSGAGEFLFALGGPGEGPGEFLDPWQIAPSPSGRVYVLDRMARRLAVFEPDGTFLHRLELPPLEAERSGTFFLPRENLIVISAVSLHERYYGKAIHVFEIRGDARRPLTLAHLRSFGDTGSCDPAIHLSVVGGKIYPDLDGNVLYCQFNPYDLRKYSLEGELLWRLEDPDAMRPATSFFRFTPEARVILLPFDESCAFLPLNDELWLHIWMRSPEAEVADDPERAIYFERVFELVPRPATNGQRVRFEVNTPLLHDFVDAAGKLYGLWDSEYDPHVVRPVVRWRPKRGVPLATGETEEDIP